jgi:hypothetical protein
MTEQAAKLLSRSVSGRKDGTDMGTARSRARIEGDSPCLLGRYTIVRRDENVTQT